MAAVVVASFRGKKHLIDFNDALQANASDWLDTVSVGELASRISTVLGIPFDALRLLASGDSLDGFWRRSIDGLNRLLFNGSDDINPSTVMTDLNAPLSFYRLKSGSTVMVMAQESPGQKVEQAVRQQLQHVDSVLLPMVTEFESHCASADHSSLPGLQREYARLSELLLQSLIKIDCIECDSQLVQQREKRRQAVKYVQSKMDYIDAIKANLPQSQSHPLPK